MSRRGREQAPGRLSQDSHLSYLGTTQIRSQPDTLRREFPLAQRTGAWAHAFPGRVVQGTLNDSDARQRPSELNATPGFAAIARSACRRAITICRTTAATRSSKRRSGPSTVLHLANGRAPDIGDQG